MSGAYDVNRSAFDVAATALFTADEAPARGVIAESGRLLPKIRQPTHLLLNPTTPQCPGATKTIQPPNHSVIHVKHPPSTVSRMAPMSP